MPNATAKALEQRLLRAFPPNQPYVPGDWQTAAMPGVVQSFLQHRLLEQLDEIVHTMRQTEMAWVDDSDPELETARAAFEEALRANGQIPESDWGRLIRQATRVGVAYLVRPVPTAAAYLFEGRDSTLSVAYIAYRMQALAPYEYLRQGLDAFARHRDVQRLDAGTFRSALTRIDRMLTRDYSVARWVDTLQPLFDVAEAAYGEPGCPVRVLHPFFAHKEQPDYADRLRALGDDRTLTPDELRAVLDRAPDAAPAAPESQPEPPAAASPNAPFSTTPPDTSPADDTPPPEDTLSAQADTSSPAASAPPAEASEEVPAPDEAPPSRSLWHDEPASADAPESPDEAPDSRTPTWGVPEEARPVNSEPEADTGSNGQEQKSGSVPRWKQFQSAEPASESASKQHESAAGGTARWQQFGSNEAAAPSGGGEAAPPQVTTQQVDALEADALGDLDADRRRLFIEQLFDGSAAHYAQVLSALGDANSWREASQIIAKDVFRRNKINIYSDAAVNFTNAVERRYR